MNWLARTILCLLAWGACLFTVLQVGQASSHGFQTHSICGPWGCGPPIPALLAWHGFCLLLLAPPVGLIIWHFPSRRLLRVGLVVTGLAVLILAAVGVWQAVTWFPRVPAGQPTYFLNRFLFSVITLVDVPVIPIGLSGLAMWIGSRVKRRAPSVEVVCQDATDGASQ